MLGKTVGGRYKLIYCLGAGAFGRAYLAKDVRSFVRTWCVVKQLNPVIDALNHISLDKAQSLFYNEAQAFKKLGTHNQIPRFLNYFQEDYLFYLFQEFIDGHELSEELANNPKLSERQVCELLQDLLGILAFVHKQNVIHRDIKPSNIIRRREDGRLVLIDFGAAKIISLASLQGQLRTIGIGTHDYMPSEQANGNPKLCSDVYALGIIGIQSLIGSLPTVDLDTGEIIWRKQVRVSSDLAEILDGMVCYDFRQRYKSAVEALDALNQILPYNIVKSSGLKFKKLKLNYAELWYKRGNERKNRKQHEAAVALYEKAIEIKPNYAKAWFNRGIALKYMEQYEDAIASYYQAIQIKPHYFEAWLHQGIALYELKQYEAAITAYEKVIEIKPYYAVTWLHRGLALYQLQQYQEAICSYNEAVRLRPSYDGKISF